MTKNELKNLLSYDPETGMFRWLVSRRGVAVGTIAGCIDPMGYWQIWTGKKNYRAHRLAFLCMTGSFPPKQIDHINGDRSDNRWSNLRAATASENGKNQKLRTTNKSGVIGVHWSRSNNSWCAQITSDCKVKHLGSFVKIDDAIKARALAEKELGFHANHGRSA